MQLLITLFFLAHLFIFPAQTIPQPINCVATVSGDITIFANQENPWQAVTWQTDKPCRLDFVLVVNGNLAQIASYELDAPDVFCVGGPWHIACMGTLTQGATLNLALQGLTTLGNTDVWLQDHTGPWQRIWITSLQKLLFPIIQLGAL